MRQYSLLTFNAITVVQHVRMLVMNCVTQRMTDAQNEVVVVI